MVLLYYLIMKKFLSYLLFVLLAFSVGYLSSVVQETAMLEWYPHIAKSTFTPPGIVFAIAWAVLYLLMAVSAAMVWNTHSIYTWLSILLFFLQLVLNFAWSVTFFYMRSPAVGLVVLTALIIVVAIYAASAYMLHRAAGLLNLPYLLWLFFALYLNAYVVLNN